MGKKTYYNLSDVDKAKVPYTGNDTLVFVSNTNDTAICIGQGKEQIYTEVCFTSVECEPNCDYFDGYKYSFFDKNNLLNLLINQTQRDEVMDIYVSNTRLYPINLSFLTQKYYDDSVTTNKNTYLSVVGVLANHTKTKILQKQISVKLIRL